MRLLLLAALVLPGVAASAGESTLTLDPTATTISFQLDATGHDVHGTFALREGAIRFDPATGTASGELVIDAASGESGNKKRDTTMRRKVLETESHPLFTFRAERLEGRLPQSGTGEVRLHGVLSIHGAEHPLVLVTRLEVTGDRLSATTTFPVPYVAWGMHDPSILILRVAKVVEITVSTSGRISTGEPGA